MKVTGVLLLVLCALVAILTFAFGAPQGAGADYLPLPWEKFSEAAKDTVNVQTGGCPEQPVYEFAAEKNGQAWVFLYGIKSNRLLVLYYPSNKPGSLPSKVAVGLVDPEHADKIPPMRIVDASKLTVCELLRGDIAGKPQQHQHTI